MENLLDLLISKVQNKKSFSLLADKSFRFKNWIPLGFRKLYAQRLDFSVIEN